jgi:Domain of unknown function (DUF1833)
MTVSAELARIYTTAPVDDRVLETLEIAHSKFNRTYYITNSDNGFDAVTDATGVAVRFATFPFSIKLPNSGEDGFSDLTISISNVTPLLVEELKRAIVAPEEPVTFLYRAYAESNLTKVGFQLPPMSASLIVVDQVSISAQASLVDLVNRNFPNQLYTPTLFPMLVNVS